MAHSYGGIYKFDPNAMPQTLECFYQFAKKLQIYVWKVMTLVSILVSGLYLAVVFVQHLGNMAGKRHPAAADWIFITNQGIRCRAKKTGLVVYIQVFMGQKKAPLGFWPPVGFCLIYLNT